MKFSEMEHLRREYRHGELLENDLCADPIEQFDKWFREALAAGIDMADAMTLATVSKYHIPSVRTVALRSYDERGFVFHTNYRSNKAKEIAKNPHVASAFYWKELDRQVIIIGTAEKISKAESDEYFLSRPIESNLVQSVSRQSQIVKSKDSIKERIALIKGKHAERRPLHWVGYRIVPNQFEFWQGGLDRLHDRFRYQYKNSVWRISRLEP